MLNASHSQMNRAALSAESTKSTPPRWAGLLATTPTGRPSSSAEPDDELAGVQRLDLEERLGVDQAVDEVVHVVRHRLVGRDHVGRERPGPAAPARRPAARLATTAGGR